jgi:hypothetical protein
VQGKIVNVEDYVTNRPVKVLLIKPNLAGESAVFKRLKDSEIRTLKVVFGESTREIRLVLPDSVGEEDT